MPTNKRDSDETEEKFPSFESLWREEWSVMPEAPNDWEKREVFRVFAKKIYERLVLGSFIENMLRNAYNEGYADGEDETRTDAGAHIDEMSDHIISYLEERKGKM